MFAFQVNVNFVGFITGKGPSSNLFFLNLFNKRNIGDVPQIELRLT